ncbi:hypothetical protein [Paenarthrobacter sp. YIM B13468]|uniref:hypothetical protein n=1 Tax=Paenarthrobacter sp. YIM B13468 TaxID=3366295 RepID=UPI00366C5184
MRSRIAQIPALAGYTQQFRTSATDRLEHAAAQLRERMDKLVKSGKMNAELAERPLRSARIQRRPGLRGALCRHRH